MDSEEQSEGFEGAEGGWGDQMVGIGEGMDCMEHWVSGKNNEYCYAENKFLKNDRKY